MGSGSSNLVDSSSMLGYPAVSIYHDRGKE